MLSTQLSDTFQVILAQLFEKFKLKNPIVAAIVLLLLGVCNLIANFGDQLDLDIFTTKSFLANIVSIGSLVFGYLIQSKTFNILNPQIAKEQENKVLESKEEVKEVEAVKEIETNSILYGINTTPIGIVKQTKKNDIQ